MKVRILTGVCGKPWNLAYFPGDVAELPKPLALELIEAKAAEAPAKAATKKADPDPEKTKKA